MLDAASTCGGMIDSVAYVVLGLLFLTNCRDGILTAFEGKWIVIFTCMRIDQLSIYDLNIYMSLALQFYLTMDHIPSKKWRCFK